MERLLKVFRKRKVLVGIGLLTIVVVGGLWMRSARLDESSKARFLARIRHGLGSEVVIHTTRTSVAAIAASIDSVSSFLYRRSGVALSNVAKTRLADLEDKVLNGGGRRITTEELVDAMTATAIERLSGLTDAEIEGASKTLCGFSDPDLPPAFRQDRVKLRASIGTNMTAADFAAEVRGVRDSNDRSKFETAARGKINQIVTERLKCFAQAVPEKFSNTWNPASDSSGDFTPVQAILVAYSAVTDDYLADSGSNLRERMNFMRDVMAKKLGRFPTSEGRFAYGVNGYIYASPVDVFFGDAVVSRLLDHLEEKSNQ